MSRNFELLSQIEADLRGPSYGRQNWVNREPSRAHSSDSAVNGCSDEMARLVQRVFLSGNGTAPRRVVFCGVDEENGSSLVCAQAGRALAASSSQSVCLVDANIRSHDLSKMFGVRGLTSGRTALASPFANCQQVGSNLWLAGSDFVVDDVGSILSADELKRRFLEAASAFEYVLIDAPGTSASGDATALGQAVDATVLVIEADSTRRLAARKAKEALEAAGVRVLGTVLRDRSFPIPEIIYRRL